MRCAASSTFPFSSLQGMITETESSSFGTGGGTNLPTTTCVMQRRFSNGKRAQNRLKKADRIGTYFGSITMRCVSSASNPASFIRFRMSAVESQFCSVRGTFIPTHSAKVTAVPRDGYRFPPTNVYAAGKEVAGYAALQAHPRCHRCYQRGCNRISHPARKVAETPLYPGSPLRIQKKDYAVARSLRSRRKGRCPSLVSA